MIVYVTKIVNLLASILQNFIVFTSSVGQIIVLSISTLTSVIFKIIGSLFTFFQIIYEDNINMFTEQLPNLATDLIDGLIGQSQHFQNVLSMSVDDLTFKLSKVLISVKWTLSTVFTICRDVLWILKKTVILFGDTLWLVLTFVPVHLPYLLKSCYVYFKDIVVSSVVDAYTVMLKVSNFLSDVPLESFLGLIATIIIIRSCINFRTTIQYQINIVYWILIRKIMYIYYSIYNYFSDPEGRIISQMAGGRQMVSRDVGAPILNDPDDANGSDALCVICQERQKCVLTLPCRHVCLCTECCRRLYGYQRTCPICRTFIYHSVTVYL